MEPMGVSKHSFFDVTLHYSSEYPAEDLEQALGYHRDAKDSGAKKSILVVGGSRDNCNSVMVEIMIKVYLLLWQRKL